jgi:hypothetical protein
MQYAHKQLQPGRCSGSISVAYENLSIGRGYMNSSKEKTMVKKSILFLGIVLCVGLTSCATLFTQKAVTIKTKSGAESGTVKIYERSKIAALVDDKGAVVYNGELPARVPVTITGGQFVVEYTDTDGSPATKVIGAVINPLLILDAAYIIGIVVDLITGNIFSYHLANKKIPINFQYQDEIHLNAWVGEGVPPQIPAQQLTVIGKLNGK